MATKSDPRQDSESLPPAELNPLVNPLLAENMGRWAEVYFTSPPEKREEAVLELVRELKAKSAQRDAAVEASLPTESQLAQLQRISLPERSSTVQNDIDVIRCHACGRENPASHRFCGMCGSPLQSEFEPAPRATETTDFHAEQPTHSFSDQWHRNDSDTPASDNLPLPTSEFSLFQQPAEGSEDWDYEDQPSGSYRIYIGLVLLLLIAGLGFMAWRSMQANSHNLPAAAPPAAAPAPENPTPTANTPPPSTQPESNNTQPAASVPHQQPPANAAAEPASDSTTGSAEAKPAGRPEKTTRSNSRQKESPEPRQAPAAQAAVPQDSSAAGNGNEELAVARRFLAGTDGQGKDSAEAAKWLWKSIAKHNGEATILLADLYLRGNGVSRNCDQARVLLYSAARRGTPGAGERLRNLPAFGCQ